MVETQRLEYGFDALCQIMARLRDRANGCPWDCEQTHRSIRNNLIEETYEAVEAIDDGDDAHLCEELGDVLLQVVFHAQMAAEAHSFTIDDVCDGICKKLILRHPHVFGDVSVKNSAEVLRNWDAIKRVEKAQKTVVDTLLGVSRTEPSLMRASKLIKKAEQGGVLEAQDESAARDKIAELAKGADDEGSVGELLMACVALARKRGLDAEETLYRACENLISAAREREN